MAHQRIQRNFIEEGANINRKAVLWRLAKLVFGNYKYSLLVVSVCIVVTSVTTLISTLFTRTLIDDYIVPLTKVDDPQYASLAQTLFKLALVLFLGVACSYLYSRLMIKVSQGTILRLRKNLFVHMESLPVNYFDTHSHGAMMSYYTNDVETLRQMLGMSLAGCFSSVITLAVTFVSMLTLSIPLTIVSIVMAFVMARTTGILGKMSRKHFRAQQDNLARVNGFIEEMVTGQKVVKVFNHEDEAVHDFEKINENLRLSVRNANNISNIIMPVNGNLSNLSYVLIAVVGALVSLGNISVFGINFGLSLGTLVAFLTLNKNFARPVASISQEVNSILNASVGAERVFALMDEKSEDKGGSIEVKKVAGGVRFKNVCFGYSVKKQILFNIDIEAMPGRKIAFVGGTGAGKTTVTNLINRFYDISSGEILFDGVNIYDISKKSLRKTLGMVLQETHLFTGTIIDNIRFGRLEANDHDCVEAAKLVGADDFIRRLGDGYHTVIDGSGGNLSQGERQLIAIARAAVANPQILILDEATSSIDTRTEKLVQNGMDSLMKGRTTFIIAHRLSTVRNADEIIVMDHGHIIEKGNHEALIEQKGKYYQLYTGNGLF